MHNYTLTEVGGGITAPMGFSAAGAHVGIKKEKKDLALFVSDVPATAAGCFTTNVVKAAPVLWDAAIAAKGRKVRAIVANSGNANACTGERGEEDCRKMAGKAADCLGICADEVFVASTGVIGVYMPTDKIVDGIDIVSKSLGKDKISAENAANAIMTTDTFMKTVAFQITLGGKNVTVAGVAKGSGMIHPNMATTLVFLTTDAAIERSMLQKALTDGVSRTFNMISVDGDTSTNDTVLILANGMAENPEITGVCDDFNVFCAALNAILEKLAKDVARDGEGATKLIEVRVEDAATEEDARKLARAVVSSNLVKAAIFGADANWGRVLSAMGYSGARFDHNKVTVAFLDKSTNDTIIVSKHGVPVTFDETRTKEILTREFIFITICLEDGESAALAWGCDLTYDYVKINGDYRT